MKHCDQVLLILKSVTILNSTLGVAKAGVPIWCTCKTQPDQTLIVRFLIINYWVWFERIGYIIINGRAW